MLSRLWQSWLFDSSSSHSLLQWKKGIVIMMLFQGSDLEYEEIISSKMLSVSWMHYLKRISEGRWCLYSVFKHSVLYRTQTSIFSPNIFFISLFVLVSFLISLSTILVQIRITFINEFGVEEAGIDGGGIFKDFMESVTRAAFDVQYGLFKVVHWLTMADLFLHSCVVAFLSFVVFMRIDHKCCTIKCLFKPCIIP